MKFPDLHATLFWVLASATALSAISVVLTQNIVRSAVWLLFSLAGTAGIFFLVGADFVAATQLIVYVGGTLVLVIFGVMLTAQGPFISMKTSAAEWAFSVVAGLVFLGVLLVTVTQGKWVGHFAAVSPAESTSAVALGESLLGIADATPPAQLIGTAAPDQPLPRTRMSYLLPFEIVSVHLLVVLIGAAYLARAKRRRGAAA
ncbi:MAG: NADH-quinone oxidoreductase subunit J [Planctomycetia bacterium]|nr:NADH-quinone oxidoreductase subunit J [Planctomycetia bacterium]